MPHYLCRLLHLTLHIMLLTRHTFQYIHYNCIHLRGGLTYMGHFKIQMAISIRTSSHNFCMLKVN